ncbi:MAG: hypothetical protein DI535_21185 [Citrobacter freundii]|nr:MAG: hypothetical protein DI535_21185 [Citrobacter freundii]
MQGTIEKDLRQETKNTGTTIQWDQGRFLAGFLKWSWIILIFAGIVQCIVWPYLKTAFAFFVILVAWRLVTRFVMRAQIIREYPLSSFVILGFSLSQYCFPLVFTLMEGKPVTYNLKLPFTVFVHSLLAIVVVISAHLFYRFLRKSRPILFNRFQLTLAKGGIFRAPGDAQIWMMGIIGLAAMFYVYFYSPSVGNEVEGAGNKFIQGLIPFTYAPFYLLIKPMFGRYDVKKTPVLPFVIFVILLFIVSIGRNSRGAFMFGFTGLGFGYIWGLLQGIFPGKILTVKNLIIGGVCMWIITGPFADLGTAMVIVRGERFDMTRSQLLSLTLEKYNDKKALAARKKFITEVSNTGWDEHYLDNVLLSRFTNLKFNDASLEISEKIGIDPVVQSFAIERPLAILPQPFIDFLGLDIDKAKVNAGSTGDILFERVGGSNAIGTFRVGHFAGVGMASFGWLYLVFLFILIIPVFFLWDLLVIRVRVKSKRKKQFVFSMAVLLSMHTLYFFINFENVFFILQFLIRNWIELVLLYLFLFHCTRFATLLVRKRN